MSVNNQKQERKVHLWGWIMFLVCAVFFIAASVESGSTANLVGSIIFLIACLVFLIPLIKKGKETAKRYYWQMYAKRMTELYSKIVGEK